LSCISDCSGILFVVYVDKQKDIAESTPHGTCGMPKTKNPLALTSLSHQEVYKNVFDISI